LSEFDLTTLGVSPARTRMNPQPSAERLDLLANLSHEARNALNVMLGHAQILAREELTTDQHAMLQHIRDAGRSLLYLLNDILDFSKMESGQLAVQVQDFDVKDVLIRIESFLGPSAREKGLDLMIQDCRRNPMPLSGDPHRLEQILINLGSNAIKFTEQGSVIVLVTERCIGDDRQRLRFEIHDSGIGIQPERLDDLFEPYIQADASIARRFGGTGLGLSICKRLVTLMDGSIGAASLPSRGSCFWFELSFRRASQPILSPSDNQPAWQNGAGSRLSGLHVLAVDDSRANLMLLERALKLEGAMIVTMTAADEAIQILKAMPHQFHVVLMDIRMPGLDGLTATQLIRQHPMLSEMPIIALTAGILPEELHVARAAGVNDFIAKPLDIEKLVGILRTFH